MAGTEERNREVAGEQRSRVRPSPGSPVVFTHIPKTAGTSLREAVREGLDPEVVFNGFGLAMFGGYRDVESLSPSIRRHVAIEPRDLPHDAEFISGHIPPSVTRFRFPEAEHFTVFREPRVRLISAWLFARAHSDFSLRRWGSFSPWITAARSSLAGYASNPHVAAHVDNCATRLLLWPHPLIPAGGFVDPVDDDELFERAVGVLDTFGYSGVVEDPGFVDELGDWLGADLTVPTLNEVAELSQPDRPDLEAELRSSREVVALRTRIDTRLWNHVAARSLDGDLEQVRERAFERAVTRYADLIARPVQPSRRRRVLEGIYGAVRRNRHSLPDSDIVDL